MQDLDSITVVGGVVKRLFCEIKEENSGKSVWAEIRVGTRNPGKKKRLEIATDFPYQNLISSFLAHVLNSTPMSLKSIKLFLKYPTNKHKNRKTHPPW